MQYDKEHDRIISAAGVDLKIYPIGLTFHKAEAIEIDIGDDSLNVPAENLRELIDGLTQAAARIGI